MGSANSKSVKKPVKAKAAATAKPISTVASPQNNPIAVQSQPILAAHSNVANPSLPTTLPHQSEAQIYNPSKVMTNQTLSTQHAVEIKSSTSQHATDGIQSPIAQHVTDDAPLTTGPSAEANLSSQASLNGSQASNFGELRELSGFVFLETEIPIKEGITSLVYQPLPNGYSLPSSQDYANLLAALGPNAYQILTDPKGFGGKEGMNYMTTEKSCPGITSGKEKTAWQFKGLVLKKQKAYMDDVATFFCKNALIGKLIPKKDNYDFKCPKSGSINIPIVASVADPKGVISAEWVFGDGGKASGLSASYKYAKAGEYDIEVSIRFFGNITLKGKKKIIVFDPILGEDEIFKGVNYGKPVLIGKQIWLNKDVDLIVSDEGNYISLLQGKGPGTKGENSYGYSLISGLPGWRLPTQNEFKQLMEFCGKTDEDRLTTLLFKEGFNGEEEHYYISSDMIDENHPASLYIGKSKISIEKRFRCSNSNTFFATRLIADSNPLLIPNFAQQNVHLNEPFHYKMLNSNIIETEWEFEPGKFSKDKEPIYTYTTPGFKMIKVVAKLFGNRTFRDEFEILLVGSSKDRKIDPSKIVVTKIADNAFNQLQITICQSTASITPRNGGGYYVCWRDKKEKMLMLQSFNDDGKEIGARIHSDDARVVDICSYPKGCIVMAWTEDERIFLTGFADDGKINFSRNLINNGKCPTEVTEQLWFCNSTGKPFWGSNLMYRPDNGKIIYANKRIITLFSHYNLFSFTATSRDAHTGDCMLSFNDTAGDEKCAWIFGVSHSVLNTMKFDGQKIISASLGDAYPTNISIANNETTLTNGEYDGKAKKENVLWSRKRKCTVEGCIPGNGGATAGRIGTIVQIDDLYYLPYSRAPAKYGDKEENKVDEFAVLVFTQDLRLVRTMNLGKGGNIMTIKSCLYGANILILLAEEETSKNVIGWPPHLNLAISKVIMMLVSPDGKILQREELKGVGMTGNDDMRVMGDGSIAWTWVDGSELKVCKMP